MTSRENGSTAEGDHGDGAPENPQARPAETVDALGTDETVDEPGEQGVAAEDVTENPESDELEGLPGPSPDEPGESAG